jgi:hypothetical protein
VRGTLPQILTKPEPVGLVIADISGHAGFPAVAGRMG